MLISLYCKQCGGEIQVQEELVASVEIGEARTIRVTGKGFFCAHCGTLHEKDDLVEKVQVVHIEYADEVHTGDVIHGDKVGGDKITGDKIVGGSSYNVEISRATGVVIGRNPTITMKFED